MALQESRVVRGPAPAPVWKPNEDSTLPSLEMASTLLRPPEGLCPRRNLVTREVGFPRLTR